MLTDTKPAWNVYRKGTCELHAQFRNKADAEEWAWSREITELEVKPVASGYSWSLPYLIQRCGLIIACFQFEFPAKEWAEAHHDCEMVAKEVV